jgi:hypothetical protein
MPNKRETYSMAALIVAGGNLPDAQLNYLTQRLAGLLADRRRDRVASPGVLEMLDRITFPDLPEEDLAASVVDWAKRQVEPAGHYRDWEGIARLHSRLTAMLAALDPQTRVMP